ncbi:hypothetical protein [Paraburkholderia atlantica]|uniref:hypothetical protein n=1 Tax=Paraburkholderia atlantica TaxID=2654982 RepID=UPI0017F00E7E|nr:hypothetical protein [Paraburkholderia atlantica]MBB5417060.1 putative protein tyrosine phosphatase [Paraburkholderia atlantica]
MRFGDVVSRIYRARAGKRSAYALSTADAERLPRLPSVAVISITSLDWPPADLDFAHVLRLSFADVDFLSRTPSRGAQQQAEEAFTPQQARLVLQFVEGLPDSVWTVIVHCESGYSRSCAVVLGLHQLYGYEVEHEQLANANPSVLRVLTRASQRTGIEQMMDASQRLGLYDNELEGIPLRRKR